MSAINPIVQTPPRLNPDQYNSGGGQTTAPAGQQGFSDTLNSVGPKPVRKSSPSKGQHANGSGDTLPATGNHSPSATPASPCGAANAGAIANSAGGSSVIGTANVATGAAQTVSASSSANAAIAAAASAANATPVADTAPAANATLAANMAPTIAAPPTADAPVGNLGAVSTNDAAATTINNSATQDSLQGQTGAIPQSTAAEATGPPDEGAPSAASSAAATAALAGQAPTANVAAKSTAPTSANWIAGRSPTTMRAIYPTGNSGATATGKPTVAGQDPGNAPVPDAPAVVTTPPAQVDTAAMIGAMQITSPVYTSSTADSKPAAPPVNPNDATAGPSNLLGANSDVTSALPALAAAAASAAQVVSTVAAGAAADKKSHDSQSQVAATSGASSTSDAAGAAQLLNAQGATHTDSAAVPTFKVSAPVDSPEFGQNVASHVSTMLDGNVNSAKLQVNPPALGPIEVRISIQGDHAQVWMASHSAMTRDALQDAAPQLREMLNSQGFAQVSVDISQRSFQERTPTAHTYEWNGESNAASTPVSGGAASGTSRASSGMLDAYA